MYRPAFRAAAGSSLSRALPRPAAARRFLTTAPPHKTSRSWKNSAARWTAAGAILYYYNTAAVFADEPQYAVHAPPETSRETETYPTIDSLAEQRRAQARSQAQSTPKGTASVAAPEAADAAPGGPEDLEEEASQQGAFNEETGEINWDCPCLGGMAHGPCGEQFRTAFSCFVFSKEEPKGVDCIEHFKAMQDCFREHPDIYGAELDDVDADDMPPAEGEAVPATPRDAAASTPHDGGEKVSKGYGNTGPEAQAKTERAVAAGEQVKRDHGAQESLSESKDAVPKAWHDSTEANATK